jgi:hypothetical protein
LHFVGTFFVIASFIGGIITQNGNLLFAVPFFGYGFAWFGHFIFEKNRPATFVYPLYSLGSDFVMFWHILTGQINQKNGGGPSKSLAFPTNGNNTFNLKYVNPIHWKQKTHQVIDAYIRLLDKYSLRPTRNQQPDENSWSIGQVYIHVWMASKGFFFKNAALCLSGETAVKGKSKKLIAYPIFLFEKMPTVKIKMPDKVAVQPRQPESKEQLVQKLYGNKSIG